MSIPYTQFMLPDGRRVPKTMDRPEPIENRAQDIIEEGFEFQMEILTTGEVSMTIFDPYKETDVAIQICDNGPAVPACLDMMIQEFDIPKPKPTAP